MGRSVVAGAPGSLHGFPASLSVGTNAPVAVGGDYVIAGAGASQAPSQQRMNIAYKLGATGKLPDTMGS